VELFYQFQATNNLALIDALTAHAQMTKKLAILRTQTKKERQINRRVELNLEIRNMQDKLEQIVDKIGGE
jgi:hypothetical protein